MGRNKLKGQQITNDNIHKHRKAVLKNGRKFKFPVQYLQHRVIINTILIGLGVLIAISGVSYWQLYHMHNTGDVLYGITRIFPLPVAKIDGHQVLFSDYLALYRSSIAVVERQEGEIRNNADNAERLMRFRRMAMDTALENGFAMGLAREMGISVSREEIDEHLVWHRSNTGTEVSEASFAKIVRDNYNLSMAEYRRLFIELPLIRSRVAVQVDVMASITLDEIKAKLGTGKTLQEIAEEMGDKVIFEDSGGEVSVLNLDGGRALRASEMEVGQASEPFLSRSSDEFFIVKTTTSNDGRVSYESLKIPLTTFRDRFRQIKDEGRYEEFIKIDYFDNSN